MSIIGNSRWRPIGYDSRQVWEVTAAELGLSFETGTIHEPPVIYGRLDGYYLEITCTNDSPDASLPITRYGVEYVTGNAPVTIGRDSVLKRSRLGRRFNDSPDIEVGDSTFDRAARIDAPSLEAAQTFLTRERKVAILNLLSNSKLRQALITELATSFETRKVEDSARHLASTILDLVRFASVMGPPSTVAQTLFPSTQRVQPSEPQLRSYFDEATEDSPLVSDSIR